MKHLMLFILLAIIINGCAKKPKDLLIGRWEEVLDINNPLNFDDSWKYWVLTFYRDGTGSLETHFKNGQLNDLKSFTYRIIYDGKGIQIIYSNNLYTNKYKSEEWTIVKLSEKKMTLKLLEMDIDIYLPTFRKVR